MNDFNLTPYHFTLLTTLRLTSLHPPANCNCQPLTYAGVAMLTARSPSHSLRCNNHFLVLVVAVILLLLLLLPYSSLAIRTTHSDRIDSQLTNSTADSNVSLSTTSRQGSFADIIDRALQHEFTEESDDQNQQGNNLLNYFNFIRSWFIVFNVRYDFYWIRFICIFVVVLQFKNFQTFLIFRFNLITVPESGGFNNSVAEQQVSLSYFNSSLHITSI